MANLKELVTSKTERDAQWKEQRQAERESIAAMRDASVTEITSSPKSYGRWLETQGQNLLYSPGNVALAMAQLPETSLIATVDRWKTLGRSVLVAEQQRGAKIFSRAEPPARGYTLADVYDVSQTQGREVKQVQLQNDTPQMETAMSTLLNYSPVPVEVDEELGAPAFYDQEAQKLLINPDHSDHEAFASIAAEIAHARFHNKGYNKYYNRAESDLDAGSVAYLLCRHLGVECPLPDTSQVAELYNGFETADRAEALNGIQELAKQIGRSIDRDLAPHKPSRAQQQRRSAPRR